MAEVMQAQFLAGLEAAEKENMCYNEVVKFDSIEAPVVEAVGIAAGLFVILAFYAVEQVWLRRFAIISNLLFIVYAMEMRLWPILTLHGILLHLNVQRLRELGPRRTGRCDDFSMSDEERTAFLRELDSGVQCWTTYWRPVR